MTRAEVYESSVAKGAAFLDKEADFDWRERIDVTTLDLGVADRCILGQLYGDYGDGVWMLGISDATELGFTTEYSYRVLTRYWKEELSRSA